MQSDDVNFKGVMIFLAILAAVIVAFYLSVTGFMRGLEKRKSRADAAVMRQLPSAAAIATRPYFPQPREQPDPMIDLQRVQAREQAELNSYGWVDRSNGIVRIPIERAMDLMASQPERIP